MEHVGGFDAVPHFVPDHVPSDLAKPFNLFTAEGMEKCPFQTAQRMRELGRIFWNSTNPLFRGSWVLTQAEDMRHVLNSPQLFSSHGQAGFMTLEGAALTLIPLEADQPRHTKYRQLLNPLISPGVVAKMTEGVSRRAIALIEAVREQGHCEFNRDFAIPFPVSIFLQLMGLPEQEMDRFLAWESVLVHTGDTATGNAAMETAAIEITEYLNELAAARRLAPQDDLASFIVNARIDGELLDDKEVLGIMYLLFLAGLDTVTATTGWIFHHLAENPDQQQRLRENPDQIPKAIEELLRRFSIITTHRRCNQDVEVAGVSMKAGDWITVPYTLGSTDGGMFHDPMTVDLDRKNARHFAFGFGPHFCMGSHLARRELDVALREWLARIPNGWRVKPGVETRTHGGHSIGFDRIDLVWDV